jgi:hypothetical protein
VAVNNGKDAGSSKATAGKPEFLSDITKNKITMVSLNLHNLTEETGHIAN